MKKILAFLLLLIVSVGLSTMLLQSNDITLESIEEEEKTIVLITKMKSGDYWQSVLKGGQAAEQEFGISLIFDAPDEEDDVQGQIDILEFYIGEGVDGIVLAASDYEALVPSVERAYNLGIPVILIDSQVNSSVYHKSFSTDNYLAGKQAGLEALKLMGQDAKVGIISFVKGSENAIQRERGVRDVLETYDGIEILNTVFCMSSIELAETQAMIFEDKGVDMIIGLNAIASTGMGRALAYEKMSLGVGFDSTQEEIEYVDQGVIDATIIQNPFGMGYLGVKYAALGFDYKDDITKKDNLIDTFVINQGNMFSKENQKLVFPFSTE